MCHSDCSEITDLGLDPFLVDSYYHKGFHEKDLATPVLLPILSTVLMCLCVCGAVGRKGHSTAGTVVSGC